MFTTSGHRHQSASAEHSVEHVTRRAREWHKHITIKYRTLQRCDRLVDLATSGVVRQDGAPLQRRICRHAGMRGCRCWRRHNRQPARRPSAAFKRNAGAIVFQHRVSHGTFEEGRDCRLGVAERRKRGFQDHNPGPLCLPGTWQPARRCQLELNLGCLCGAVVDPAGGRSDRPPEIAKSDHLTTWGKPKPRRRREQSTRQWTCELGTTIRLLPIMAQHAKYRHKYGHGTSCLGRHVAEERARIGKIKPKSRSQH